MSGAFSLRPGDAATVIHGAGDDYRYLATGEQTNGKYFALEATVPPGAGPPPHIQSNEEEVRWSYFVGQSEGDLKVDSDGLQSPRGPA